jgi:hypothetical protein
MESHTKKVKMCYYDIRERMFITSFIPNDTKGKTGIRIRKKEFTYG